MSWINRLIHSLRPRGLDRDLADEYQDHLARRAADLERQGFSPADASRRAAVRFGNSTGFRERSRETRLLASLDETLQDLRYGYVFLPVFA